MQHDERQGHGDDGERQPQLPQAEGARVVAVGEDGRERHVASATFAISDGWIEKPGSSIHEREPLIVLPRGVRTATRASNVRR